MIQSLTKEGILRIVLNLHELNTFGATAHGQVAFEDATDAKLLLSAVCKTERLASTTRSQRQSLCAQFPYKFKQEDCDWANHDCEKVMKMSGIKRCKTEPWLRDNCV